jgi:transcription factor C subunit 6
MSPKIPHTDWLLEFTKAIEKLSGQSPVSPRKLGLLAGVFEDGSLSVYAIPYPQDLASAQPSSTVDPIYGNIFKRLLESSTG